MKLAFLSRSARAISRMSAPPTMRALLSGYTKHPHKSGSCSSPATADTIRHQARELKPVVSLWGGIVIVIADEHPALRTVLVSIAIIPPPAIAHSSVSFLAP